MAQINNVFDTYDAQADREQLSNVIYNISPTATPFMSSIGKNSIKNVVFDWQTEALPTPNLLVVHLLQLGQNQYCKSYLK